MLIPGLVSVTFRKLSRTEIAGLMVNAGLSAIEWGGDVHVPSDAEEDILENFSVEIARHEFVTILGPSGCGKTTMLRLIGGFETPDSGQILFDGEDITNLPPYKRHLNTVFQKYALFPHMNVFDNVAFGLTIKKVDKKIKLTSKPIWIIGKY